MTRASMPTALKIVCETVIDGTREVRTLSANRRVNRRVTDALKVPDSDALRINTTAP